MEAISNNKKQLMCRAKPGLGLYILKSELEESWKRPYKLRRH